mmetsp:Transcript_20135/g.56634  ORF Transcript_20135/g.56634 Transcript_20135/m.56634 type:complete len:229 (-) Transcript_20135:511-1197(-)
MRTWRASSPPASSCSSPTSRAPGLGSGSLSRRWRSKRTPSRPTAPPAPCGATPPCRTGPPARPSSCCPTASRPRRRSSIPGCWPRRCGAGACWGSTRAAGCWSTCCRRPEPPWGTSSPARRPSSSGGSLPCGRRPPRPSCGPLSSPWPPPSRNSPLSTSSRWCGATPCCAWPRTRPWRPPSSSASGRGWALSRSSACSTRCGRWPLWGTRMLHWCRPCWTNCRGGGPS